MVSKRIKLIASLLDKDDKVLDVGTDHALLPIYLVKNKLVAKVDASDISSVVLSNAKKNVTKFKYENDINLYLSD
nr:class I SAM-dependent methyltransferase [Bacilli bacterium]